MEPNPLGLLLDAVCDEVWPVVEAAALRVPSLRYTLEKASRLSSHAWRCLYDKVSYTCDSPLDEVLELMALVARPLAHAERMTVVTDARSSAVLTRLVEHNRLERTERTALVTNPAARSDTVMAALLATAELTPLDLRTLAADSSAKVRLMWALHVAERLPADELTDLAADASHALGGCGYGHEPELLEAIFDLRPEIIGPVLDRSTDAVSVLAAAGPRAVGNGHVEVLLDAVCATLDVEPDPLPEKVTGRAEAELASSPDIALEVLITLSENPYVPPASVSQVCDVARGVLGRLQDGLHARVASDAAARAAHLSQLVGSPDPPRRYEFALMGTRIHASAIRELVTDPSLSPAQLGALNAVVEGALFESVAFRAWLAPAARQLAARLHVAEQSARVRMPVPPGLVPRLSPEQFEADPKVIIELLPNDPHDGRSVWLADYGRETLSRELAVLATERLGHDTGTWETFFSLADDVRAPVGDLLDAVLGVHGAAVPDAG